MLQSTAACWADDAAWRLYRPVVGWSLPRPLRAILPLIRRGVIRSLKGQGIARHSTAEVAAIGIADFNALSTLLGDQRYLFGSAPGSYDASGFAFVHGVAAFPHDS